MSLSASSTLYGIASSSSGSTLAVTLDDGTEYSDLHALSWLDASELVGYSTDVPAAVTVDAEGGLTLLDNHWGLVAVTATTKCSPAVAP